MIDGVCADRHAICGSELKELCRCHGTGIRRRCRPDGPTLRDRVKSRFDLRHGEGQQVATHVAQVSIEVRAIYRDAESPTACSEAEFAHRRRAGTQENGQTIPPKSRVAREEATRHKNGDGYALRCSDGKCVGEVVAVAVVEGDDNSGSTRGSGKVIECRWFTSTHKFIKVGGKVVGTHAEPERVLCAFSHPVVAENDRSARCHGAHLPQQDASSVSQARLHRTKSVSPPFSRPSLCILTLTRRRLLCEQLARDVSRPAEHRAQHHCHCGNSDGLAGPWLPAREIELVALPRAMCGRHATDRWIAVPLPNLPETHQNRDRTCRPGLCVPMPNRRLNR